MRSFVKPRLRNTLFIALCLLVLGPQNAGAATQTWIRVPQAKNETGEIRRDELFIRYKPTGKSVLLGVYGKARLTPHLLKNLGVDESAAPRATDFEFYRIFSTSHRRSVRGQWDAGIESWAPNPSTKDLWLAREAMSVMRTREEPPALFFDLAPTAMALGPIAVPNKVVSTEDPVKAKAARRKVAIAQLEKSWQQVLDKKYDLSLVGFDGLLGSMKDDLNAEEQNKALFGRALSKFHQMGCREVGNGFEELQTPGPYLEDSRYYGALCALDRSDLKVAHERFQMLMQTNSERYEDAARFYLGVVAEAQEDFDGAESAYLDTVDFAKDQGIVALAKDKLALLEDKKAADRYAKKLFSIMASAGLGWDSNALSLPTSIQPSDLNLDSGASATYLGLAYIDFKNPLLRKLGNKLHYSYLMLGYLNSEIAPTSDLQSHSFGTSVEWGEDIGFHHAIDAKYGLTYLGKIGSSAKYLTSYGLRWDGSRSTLDVAGQQLDHVWLHSFEVSHQAPEAVPVDAANDGTGWLVSGSHRLREQHGTKLWGPGGEWEYKASKGKEPRYVMLGATGSYEQPVGPETLKLKFSQDAALRGTFYFQSTSSRKDYLVTTTSSLAHSLSDKFEARAQLVLSKNFSAESFSYNRYQLNLMLNAFF
ncbi:MAG: hypothetical protein ABIR96_01035 [Bdellovibrionota bacterium]